MHWAEEFEKKIPHYKRPSEFTYLILPEWRIKSSMFKQQATQQLSLIKSIEDEVFEMMPKLLKTHKRKTTQIKEIAKRYDLNLNEAKRIYEAAYDMFVYELNRKHYLENKEYFDWLEKPETAEFIRQYIEKCDEEYERRKKEFENRVREGKEHVVRIEVNDSELEKLLDNPFYASINYHGPFSALIQSPGITEHDVKILLARGYIKIEAGNPDTILQYEFSTKREEDENRPRYVCVECGMPLDYNDIGLNKKLGAKDEQFYKCPRCLGLTEEHEDELIEFYRSSGCRMFI